MLLDHILGVLGFLVGLAGLGYAVRSDRKTRTAERERSRIERKFRQYIATQEFRNLTLSANALIQEVRASAWASVANASNSIGAALLQARGAHATLLNPLERDKVDVAVADFQQFLISVPLQEQTSVSEDQTKLMILKCMMVASTSSEIAGRLSVESISEPEEEK